MAAGDPVINGLSAGGFYLQADSTIDETLSDWDTASRTWLAHPGTAIGDVVLVGSAHPSNPKMFVHDRITRQDESTLNEITAVYRGISSGNYSGTTILKPSYFRKGAREQVLNLPALTGGAGDPATLIVNIPMPTVTRRHLVLIEPSNDGVGEASYETFLPSPGSFSISYVPDPDQPLPLRYLTGWVLSSREWEATKDASGNEQVWLVDETYTYYWPFS